VCVEGGREREMCVYGKETVNGDGGVVVNKEVDQVVQNVYRIHVSVH
jgi:hypothetical protein